MYEIAALLMFLILAGASSVSFAASPDFIPCNYWVTINYQITPSNIGTINGFSNGQYSHYVYNNVPCSEKQFQYGELASAPAGFALSSWSASGGSLSSTTSSSTSLTVSADHSATITVNFVFPPEILNQYTYSSGGGSGSQGQSPPSDVNNTNPTTTSFTTTHNCGKAGNDPYCLWVATGQISGTTYYSILFVGNSSLCTDGLYTCGGRAGHYPNGNTTMSMTLAIVNSTFAVPTGMSIDFVNANGTIANLGDSFDENFQSQLTAVLFSMQNDVYDAGGSIVSNYGLGGPDQNKNNTFLLMGMNFVTASYALGDLPVALANCSICSSFLTNSWSINVPHLLAAVVSWHWTSGCIGAIKDAAAETIIIAGVGATTDGSGLPLVPEILAFFHVGDGIYDGFNIANNCISVHMA